MPDLPGCMTQSKTLEEVIINIEEANLDRDSLF
ncbi:type II toxin-antitoxin system HicB family antitoxin [Microcystis aeruginosa CS-567/02]|nr:type II toxin-antitoxin system HicB family antitoxin [Microcystis aeruginosa]MDB9413814.1 type II toxin-antitoxin system HicB family antitoxin [Microcystis aeruginosa CS-567/02]